MASRGNTVRVDRVRSSSRIEGSFEMSDESELHCAVAFALPLLLSVADLLRGRLLRDESPFRLLLLLLPLLLPLLPLPLRHKLLLPGVSAVEVGMFVVVVTVIGDMRVVFVFKGVSEVRRGIEGEEAAELVREVLISDG